MLVLGIETTCDETAAAVVEDGRKILSNVIFSQIPLHRSFGGVFPEIASRSHAEKIIPIIDEAMQEAKVQPKDIDLIAVAARPGLIGSLLIGVNAAKALAFVWKKPFVGVNHVEAHLYAAMMNAEDVPSFPSLGVVLSGGHTQILLIEKIGKYHPIGSTIDDAIGESFDKVASLLKLPYPGGPEIEKLAKQGDIQKFSFQTGKVKNNLYDFSFSGLKTKILYTIKGNKAKKDDPLLIKDTDKKHIAASFQHAVFADVIKKTLQAATEYNCKDIYFGGGVTNNRTLREMFSNENTKFLLHWPSFALSLDNAAMIAGLGYHQFFETQNSDDLSLEPQARMRFS